MSCGALAPQANGDGDMRVGSCREVDSERQRQQFVAPPGVRGPRPRGGHAHRSENIREETSSANAALRLPPWGELLSAAIRPRSKKSVIYLDKIRLLGFTTLHDSRRYAILSYLSLSILSIYLSDKISILSIYLSVRIFLEEGGKQRRAATLAPTVPSAKQATQRVLELTGPLSRRRRRR